MSPQTMPSTAIVVGSGCSVGLGVPAMAGFLDTLLDRLSVADEKDYPGASNDLMQIKGFISRAKGSAAYVKADLLNIEELYGMADMYEDLTTGSSGKHAQKVKMAFNRAIFYLTKKAGEEFQRKGSSIPSFPKNSAALGKLKLESQTEDPLHRNMGTRWTTLLAYLCLASFKDRDQSYPLFIQFNWDLALDRALVCWSHIRKQSDELRDVDKTFLEVLEDEKACAQSLPWYGNPDTGNCEFKYWPQVARPHGGINWVDIRGTRPKLDSKALEQKGAYRLGGGRGKDKEIWIDPRPILCENMPERTDPWVFGQHMAIIPPTWRKQSTRIAYENQWLSIKEGLSEVRRIIFIGYSLPKTDLYFRHFLALALAENNHLPRVYVLHPSIHKPGIVHNNYLDLFAPLAREGRLYGIQGRFGDPALFDLHRAIALAEPIRDRE